MGGRGAFLKKEPKMKKVYFELDEYPSGESWDLWFQRFAIRGVIRLLGNVAFRHIRRVIETDPDGFAKMIRSSGQFSPFEKDRVDEGFEKVLEGIKKLEERL